MDIAFSEINDLVFDVANFDDFYGGIWHAPVIGTVSELCAHCGATALSVTV